MSTSGDPPPLTKAALEEAFRIIESQPLAPTRIYMNKRDYDEITGKKCERCSGYYPNDLPSHPIDACDLEIARQIMES
jgi:hypothetical protein